MTICGLVRATRGHLGLALGALAVTASSGQTATIDSLTSDGTAISSAATFAEFEVVLEFQTDDDVVSIVGNLVDGEISHVVLSRPTYGVPIGDVITFRFDVDGLDTDTQQVPAGTYDLRVTVTDGEGATSATIPGIVIDRSAPQIVRATELGPEGSYRNGDVLALEIVTTERPDSIWLDTASFDSDVDAPPPIVTEVAATEDRFTYTITYRISPDNELADAASYRLEVSARDSLDNQTSTGQDLAFCLSNHPIVHVPDHIDELTDEARVLFATLVEEDGTPAVDGRSYTRGDSVRVRTVFQVARVDEASLGAIQYIGDFSAVDSEFNPFGGPGATTTTPVVTDALPDSLLAGEGYAFIEATTVYGLSPLNLRPEGTYAVTISAREMAAIGCSEADARTVEVTLADLGPPVPSFDPLPRESTDAITITLAGTAPDAERVEIALLGESRGEEAVLDTLTGRFSATLPLERGWNRFVAIGFGPFGHASPPSEVIEIYLVGSTELDAPARFRPGDAITVATEEPADRIVLEIWNLASERIWADEVAAPGSLHEFIWSGRNASGERVKTGPYLVHVTLHHGGRTSTADRAIVFTRK